MSVDKPTEPVPIYESGWDEVNRDRDEVKRAVLDQYMEVYKPEIDRNLSMFGDHKHPLLHLLFADYNRGQPTDRQQRVWFRIETIAYQYFAREKLKDIVKSNADQVARYREIADASQSARSDIEKLRYADIARKQIKAWLDGSVEFAEATKEFTDQLYIGVDFDRKIEKTIKSLAELEAAANKAAGKIHKKPGRPTGTSLLPWSYFSELAGAYQLSTGQNPNLNDGDLGEAFHDFVLQFLVAVGKEEATQKDYVSERAKYAHKLARKNPGR